MRNLTILFFAILFCQNIVAQNTSSIDERLYAVFDADYLQKLEKENSFHLKYYTYYLDNGFEIIAMAAEKKTSYETVTIDDLEGFNILKIQKEQTLKRTYETPSFYKIKGTNKLLMLRSEKDFIKRLNEHLGRK